MIHQEQPLFPHQLEAVQWMQRTEQRPRLVPEQPHGGILAHAMGLGKTRTMLALMLAQGLQSTIVVCPKSVLHQWRDEAARVLRLHPPIHAVLYHGNNRHQALLDSCAHQRLVLTTFDIVRLDCKQSGTGVSSLHHYHWDRIILDEAHRICEQSSKTAKAIRSLRAKNRWCVTGTPFKNGVSDLVALSKFLMVPPYCNSTWWRCHSQNRHKMREWRNSFLHMQDKSVLALPAVVHTVTYATRYKVEQHVTQQLQKLVPLQDLELEVQLQEKAQEHELLKIMRLRQAANHPLMLTNSTQAMTHLLTSSVVQQMAHHCDACTLPLCRKRASPGDRVCAQHDLCDACSHDTFVCPCCIAEELEVVTCPNGSTWRHSGKTAALWQYLERTLREDPSVKIVLFSQWTTCLDLLALMLDCMVVNYARFDGRVNSIDERGDIINEFRKQADCHILLTSLGAGGEGLNLIFANHVVLMEPYWNCAAEQQAIDRLHRIGQEKVTHVLRLLTADSIEDWVQLIQAKKMKELERLLCGKDGGDEVKVSKPHFRAEPCTSVNAGLSQFLA
jgi:SNF2 family DNA or RNA helicase